MSWDATLPVAMVAMAAAAAIAVRHARRRHPLNPIPASPRREDPMDIPTFLRDGEPPAPPRPGGKSWLGC